MEFSHVLDFFRGPLVQEVDSSGNLNPMLLAFATEGYRIQSQYLGIPDRWGYFSPGTPRLQVHEAASLRMAVLFTTFFLLPIETFAVVNSRGMGAHTLAKVALLAFVNVLFFGADWAIRLMSFRREPGFRWDDWKPRQD